MINDLLGNVRSNLSGLNYRTKTAQEKLKKPSVSYSISTWSQFGGKWELTGTPMGFGKVAARTYTPATGVYSYRQVVYNLSKLTMTLSSYGSHRDFDGGKLKDLKEMIRFTAQLESEGCTRWKEFEKEEDEETEKMKKEIAEMEVLHHYSDESTEAVFSLPQLMSHLGLTAVLSDNYDFLITKKILTAI